MSNQISLQIKRGGGEPPYLQTTDTEPKNNKSYYTKSDDIYTLFEGSEFAQGITYYESALKKFELGYDKTNKTLYINNDGTIEVPFASVKANNIDGVLNASQIPNLAASKITSGTLPVARGGTGLTSLDTFVRTTGNQNIEGTKTFLNSVYIGGYLSSTNDQEYSALYFRSPSFGRVNTIQTVISNNAGNRTGNRFQFLQYSYTENTTTTLNNYDAYVLPTVAAGKTSNNTYNILTSKNAVTIAQGGTGATNRKAAVDSLIYLGTNQTDLLSSTSSSTTGAYGHCIGWFDNSSTDSKKPTDYGMLLQIANGGEISQLWFEHLNGAIYHRGMNGNNAPSTIGWKKIYDNSMSYGRSSVGSLDWGSNNDAPLLKSAIAYWNGAYNTNNASNIQYVSTIKSGTWNGSTIGIGYGGTGATTKVNAQKNLGIQAGTTTANSSSITSVTFPSAFSNVPKVVASWATTSTNESGAWGALKISEITKTGFKIAAAGSNPSTAKNVEWIAVDNA